MRVARTFDAVVVGAGHAGLAVSKRLCDAGLEHVVLERGAVAETWRSQRWDSFRLNTPNGLTSLPASPPIGSGREGFEPTTTLTAYLERYVRDHGLPVRTSTAVTAVKLPDPGAFRLKTADGQSVRARNVVVASGDQNIARVPAFTKRIDAAIQVMTTGTYRRPEQLTPGAVLVVGSAQSACQIAEDLLDGGREVYLAACRVGRAPRRLRGRDTFAWLRETGWMHEHPQDLPDPTMVQWPNPQVSGTGPLGHTVSYQSLAARGVTLLGRLEAADGERLRFGDELAAHVRFADERSVQFRKTVDEHIERNRIGAPPSDPDPADEPVADPTRYTGPTELNLRDRGIRSVIFSTGFTGDFTWLPAPARDGGGAPIHVEGCSPVAGLWFVGLRWMRVRQSGIIGGAADDSAAVVGQILNRTNWSARW